MTWITLLTAAIAFYVAFNLGGNDVANSMGTSVGSKAIRLQQAILIAGILEFTGAVVFGREVSKTLATSIVSPDAFVTNPMVLLEGMMAVMVAAGLWLQAATLLGLPVSSSHAIVGAIAGVGWIAVGRQVVNWPTIGLISATWIATPLVSGAIAAGFYSLIRRFILRQPDPLQQLNEWIPWLSVTLVAVLGWIVLPSLIPPALLRSIALPEPTVILLLGSTMATGLTMWGWQRLERSPPSSNPIESHLAQFQVLSACFVAFAHGSNDVGNAIAPLATIQFIQRTETVPTDDFAVPFWILALGGVGLVTGLAVLGKRVITTIGEGIIPLQPSSGFSAELATATTVLLASRAGLPVSTSHALVGAVVGIGLLQASDRASRSGHGSGHGSEHGSVHGSEHGSGSLHWGTVRSILTAWFVTVPLSAAVGALAFILIHARLGLS